MLRNGGAFNSHELVKERVMDSNDQERERGITIYSKNASIFYKDTKINIVDTPGHADFGSEVERVLRTIDAVLLLVDAAEGPMPQTKFVLKKSLELGLKVLVVINKIDKPMARPDEVLNLTFDLFASLGASDEQLDFPYIYTIAKQGIAIKSLEDEKKDIFPLFDFIMEHVKPAQKDLDKPFRMQPATLTYDNYLGRIAVGRVAEGKLSTGKNVFVIDKDGNKRNGKITKVFTFQGIKRVDTNEIESGDIVAIAGIPDIYVGETITDNQESTALPSIKIDPPALSVDFLVNDSPFAGKEGKLVTSRNIRDRLEREIESNVGLKVEFSAGNEVFKVYGRGEMHLAVLIENMRREGFELQVSQPKVLNKMIDGVECEPLENVIINVPDDMAGKIIETLSKRKGEISNVSTLNGNTTLEFKVPTRGLLGYHQAFMLMTKGEGTFYHSFDSYIPLKGVIQKRANGSLISGENGPTMAYSLWKLQERGELFIGPGVDMYEGMIIGEHSHETDLVVNATKNKHLTNMRASGADEAMYLVPISEMTLEKALSYIKEDELIEVTPKSIRLRKKILGATARKSAGRGKEVSE